MANQFQRNPHIDHLVDTVSITQSAAKKKVKRHSPHPHDADEFASAVRGVNLPKDAVPHARETAQAKVVDKQGDNDWRVSISIPPVIKELNKY